MKRIIAISVLFLSAAAAFAQTAKADRYTPQKGDWSVGINVNPVAAGGFSYQPKKGEFVGGFLAAFSDNPAQMYIPGQSLVSIKAKNMITSSFAVKMTVGFNGSHVDYKEYVKDDYQASINSDSEALVEDSIIGNLAMGSATVGVQKYLGKGALKFTLGADVAYTIAGGHLDFKYGNDFATYNGNKPTSMSFTEMSTGKMNKYEGSHLGITYARPYKRNEIGTIQQVALMANAGLECFIADHISAGVEVCFVPVAFTWQSQTWGIYQGYSATTMNVIQYNDLVSPGSHAVTYGTNNFAVNLSINYYF